jgi:hypothetical protein
MEDTRDDGGIHETGRAADDLAFQFSGLQEAALCSIY